MPTPHVAPSEAEFTAIRAQGAGGQNVNQVSNAVPLRFAVNASSLPEAVEQRLLRLSDQPITPPRHRPLKVVFM